MATYTVSQFSKVLNKRRRELRKSGTTTCAKASKFMQDLAKHLAPKDSGETVRGIIRRKKGKGYEVTSWVPGTFKQNLWANQTAPFRTLRFPKGGWIPPGKSYTGRYVKIANPGDAIVYGQDPRFNWTGTPRFFHIATIRSREAFRKLAIKNTKKALRVSF
jgi:hypothetical protein